MIKSLQELFKALFRLGLVLSLYTCVYGGLVYLVFGFISLTGMSALTIQRSLLCGLIILLSQNILMLINKKG